MKKFIKIIELYAVGQPVGTTTDDNYGLNSYF